MRRKVIQIAGSTQLISLPRKWALENDIKKGDELDINESNKDLIVSLPSNNEKEIELELNIETTKRFLRRLLFSPYIQGYTQIKIKYQEPEVFNLISEEVQVLMGYEIINQGSNYCIIKSIATALDNDIDSIIQRIFLSTTSMMEDLKRALDQGNMNEIDNLKALEVTNNKLSYFCLRLLNREGYKDKNKTNSIYYIILCIEEIVDELRNISKYIVKKDAKLDKKTISLIDECRIFFDDIHKLFNKFDNEKLYEFSKKTKELTKELTENMIKISNDAVILASLYNIISKTSHISKEIHY